PIQLAVDEQDGTLKLMDLSKRGVIHHFGVPGALDLDRDEDTLPPVGMTRNGTLVGAGVRQGDGTPALVIWNGQSGARVHVFEGRCCAVAFSPDGALVASGDDRGRIVVRNLATGRPEAELNAGRNRVN